MTALLFRLLGPIQAWRGEQRLDEALRSHRAKELLAMLLTERDAYVPAERIVDLLWPHLEPEAAANNLQVTVRKVRRWLEPDLERGRRSRYLLTEPAGYRFRTDACAVDVDEFTDATQRGLAALERGNHGAACSALERARSLYRGDYLHDLPYAEWAFAAREHLRERHLKGLAALGDCYVQLRNFGAAVTVAEQALAIDPLRESTVRRLMQSHAAQGLRAEALAVYDTCARLLAAELGVEPARETRDLREAIWNGSFALPATAAETAPQPSVQLPFVGRDDLRDALHSAWRRRQRLVLLSGEAGLGKTRLLREFVTSLAGTPPAPVVFWSESQTGDAPYAAVLRWVEAYLQQSPPAGDLARLGPLGAALARRLPQLRRHWPGCPPYAALEDEAEEERLRQAVLAALRLAATDDTLFVLDDLHWADEASLTLLQALMEEEGPGCYLFAFRPEESGAHGRLGNWLEALPEEVLAAGALTLAPLRAPAVLSAVRALLPLPDPLPFSRRLHELTAGHPLYLAEMVRGLLDAGWLYQDAGGVWHAGDAIIETDLSDLPLTTTLREALLVRAGRLDDLARDALDAAAILRPRISFAVLEALVQASAPRLRAVLDTLVARRWLLATGDDEWAFAHHLVGEVIYGELAPSHRRLLHRLAANRLIASVPAAPNVAAVAIVNHLQEGSADAPTLCTWAVLAANWSLQQFAYREAERYFDLAQSQLEYVADGETGRALALQLHEGRGRLLPRLGRSNEALEDLEQALALATDPVVRVRLLLAAARICEHDTGEYKRALALLDEAEALLDVGPGDTREQWARLYTIQADVHLCRGRPQVAVPLARRAVAEAEGTPATYAAIRALASNLQKVGELEEAIDLYRQMLALAEGAGDLRRVGRANVSRGNGLYALGMLSAAREAYEEAGTIMERLGDVRSLSIKHTNCGIVAIEMGDLERSERDLRRAIATAEKAGAPYTVAVARHHLGKTLTLQGRTEEARADLDAAIELAEAIGAGVIAAQAQLHLALWQWAQEDVAGAAATARGVVTTGDKAGDNFCRREGRLILAAAALEGGDAPAAHELAREARRIAGSAQQALAIGRAERMLGEVAAAAGDILSAQEHLTESERVFRNCEARVEAAQTLAARAKAERAAGADPERTRLLLDEARRMFYDSGAAPWVARVDALLASL